MFGKWFASAYSGSMVGLGLAPYALLPYAVATALFDGETGTCELNPILVAAMLGCTVAEVEEAIRVLCAPDPRSRNKASAGARLVHVDAYRYEVVSYKEYRDLRNAEDRKRKDRERKAVSRAIAAKRPTKRADRKATADLVATHALMEQQRCSSCKAGACVEHGTTGGM